MARKITAPFSLGTFGEVEAQAIAAAIQCIPMGIQSVVARLFVGERDDKPTEWWHVYVPNKHRTVCETWLRGWREGYKYHVILRHKEGKGITYDEAAKQLGYGPPSLPAEHIGHLGACGTLPCLEASESTERA